MYVVPEIDKARAQAVLTRQPRPFTRKRNILKTELLYLPSFLFLLRVKPGTGSHFVEYVTIEEIHGEFALIEKSDYSPEPVTPSRIYNFVLPSDEAEAVALDLYKRILLKKSLKNKSMAVVESIELEQKFYYPYWIGYFHHKGALDFDVIDGISGKHQGPKMRSVFIELLLQQKKEAADAVQKKTDD